MLREPRVFERGPATAAVPFSFYRLGGRGFNRVKPAQKGRNAVFHRTLETRRFLTNCKKKELRIVRSGIEFLHTEFRQMSDFGNLARLDYRCGSLVR